ncbi:MAG TPA: asparagine synthase C-terminal domain-containing protein, partial [Chloroflexota bacterium]|nr:asparagine synthase C-terminal domain-containing protein [Chloroflexota bacterium]
LATDEMARRFVAGADLGGDEAHYTWRAIFGREQRLGLLAGAAREVAAGHEPLEEYLALCPHADDFRGAQRYMYLDVCTWLPNDILVKVDRTSMAHSLEVRAPFLDHRLVELAFSLPSEAHLRGMSKKRLLRRAMRGLLPDEIIDRRKRGFSAPVGAWMSGSLRDLVYDTVASRGGRRLPFFEEGALRRLVAGHDAGAGETALQVWGLLTFHLWHDWMRGLEAVPLGAPVAAGAGAESGAV